MWTVAREADHGRRMHGDSVRVWWSGVQVQFSVKTIGPLGTCRDDPAASALLGLGGQLPASGRGSDAATKGV
jgi:hypothetical protein